MTTVRQASYLHVCANLIAIGLVIMVSVETFVAVFAESREAAYVHAVSAAGIAYTVTRACSRGELNECSCDSRVRSRKPKGKWQWGGCSEVSY